MADEHDEWLDPDTAERLLRGEPPRKAVAPEERERAERIARALDALTHVPADPATGELPGEQAALAAFRAARAERGPSVTASADGSGDVRADEVGLVRIDRSGVVSGRPRPARAARLGRVLALACALVGAVTVATATGLLPAPFGSGNARPGSGVSASPTAERSRPAPSAAASPTGTAPAPGETVDSRVRSVPGTGPGGAPPPRADGRPAPSGARDGAVADACRDLRAGKPLGAERRRLLERSAGAAPPRAHCRDVLRPTDARPGRPGETPGTPRADGPRRDHDARDGHGGHHGRGGPGKGGKGRQGVKDGAGGKDGKDGKHGKDGKGGKGDGGGRSGPGDAPRHDRGRPDGDGRPRGDRRAAPRTDRTDHRPDCRSSGTGARARNHEADRTARLARAGSDDHRATLPKAPARKPGSHA